ncbi:Hermansky-Pudlak syndrome 5 protein homolog isoform X2 [Orussus abietinus]|uniref:Hermansky-Pudlak syndrome 5 protein homolog isoform X2 n=1 Tax=Orussus abietinus TaxID=222816 RepID=UPI000626CBCC|nr:Hermansky-Pudlak syndrome 5 protein homolog isoform X2 [Orussus abietinus]
MQKDQLVLSECEKINDLLYRPIGDTQRIKYTCLSVSQNYIVLGATSGSLYLFSRELCTFQQLIPLPQGAISRVLISPDEKKIALATIHGNICLVILKPTASKLVAVSTEHAGVRVTCLCWNDNSLELYIGDETGKISIMVNGMFQAPACSLMNLDSSIVQMNFTAPLLLTSTLTRCYVCDTVQEQYRQIGNKARDGEFGACFYKTRYENEKIIYPAQAEEKKTFSRMGSFSLISEGESNSLAVSHAKIYCARPGSRLWEVTANGIVTRTHQFKEALATPPVNVYRPYNSKIIQSKQAEWPPQSINFSQLIVIDKKYLFSYTSNGLYIIDPINASIVLWNDELSNITMAHVIENKIYLMTNSSTFHCLTLSSVDSLILKLYDSKKYSECLQTYIQLGSRLFKIINTRGTDEINHIDSETNLLQKNEISSKLLPLVSLLRSNLNNQPVKLDTGIVVVNSGNAKSIVEKDNRLSMVKDTSPSTSEERFSPNENSNSIEEPDNLLINNHSESQISNSNGQLDEEPIINSRFNLTSKHKYVKQNSAREETCEEDDSKEDMGKSRILKDAVCSIQSNLEPIYASVASIKPSVTEREVEEVLTRIMDKMGEVKEVYESLPDLQDFLYELIRAAELHFSKGLLENLSVDLLQTTRSKKILNEVSKIFVNLNSSDYRECSCGFPCPKDKPSEPKFLEIGKTLLKRIAEESKDNCIEFCNKVPFMWQEYLPQYISQKCNPDEVLRECIQTGDSNVLSVLLPSLDAKQWKSVVKYLKDIERGNCLLCGRFYGPTVKRKPYVDWTRVARDILKRQGSNASMTFLMKAQSFVPSMTLDRSIYQSLIFSKILEHHGVKHNVQFNCGGVGESQSKSLCATEVREQLEVTLRKDIERPIDKNVFEAGAHHWGIEYKAKSQTCPCCTLALQTPVLLNGNGISIFPCGHAYHVNCLIEKKLTRCNLHS